MATQSLYRRYRPRRFSELAGQEHIVRALRSSVAEGREGQAYLFSGPRGTGKTSSARILAKVLNCENPSDGEPCCECDSCLAVEAGTSYDVHELDAASNNGVDAMRDLIEKAALGTPGRHKVYILDEVHMLSKGAEAALLKTLEEPPPHVVFVLATTDPQKMSDTIRSRTQHLRFHLLAADTLQEHVRWVAEDAGLTVTDQAIEQVIAQGAGSPRDTLSALELVANAGGDAADVVAVEEFVEAMIEHDPARALTMAAQAINHGRDPRSVTEELIRFLREGFLSLMAPDLVQLPSQRLGALTEQAQRLGPAGLVRGIEHLGQALTEMRQAPDPRVLLDVAIVQLTSEQVADDVAGLAARLHQLERTVAAGATGASGASTAPASGSAPASTPAARTEAPVDPTTGKRTLGSRAGAAARRAPDAAASATADAPATPPPSEAVASDDPTPEPSAPVDDDAAAQPEPAAGASPTASTSDVASDSGPDEATGPEPSDAPGAVDSHAGSPAGGHVVSADDWSAIRSSFKGMIRARFAPAELAGAAPGTMTLSLPNAPHREKCEGLRSELEAAIAAHVGSPVTVEMIVGAGESDQDARGGTGGEPTAPAGSSAPPPQARSASRSVGDDGAPGSGGPTVMGATSGALAHDVAPADVPSETSAEGDAAHLTVVPGDGDGDITAPVARPDDGVANGRAIAEEARAKGPAPDPEAGLSSFDETLPHDDDVDLDGLVDAPPESVKTPIDRLAEAFPGSELVDDDPY